MERVVKHLNRILGKWCCHHVWKFKTRVDVALGDMV